MSKSKLVPAVAYLRRSDKKQEASIVEQRKAVREYAERKGYAILREYVDDGISGDSTKKRKDFLRMLADAQHGDFTTILCWDDSRFGRFDSIEAGYYIYPLREAGVKLDTVLGGPVDWDDSTGRIISGIRQEQNHEHSVKLSSNVLRGQVEAAKDGSWCGTAPYGYRIEGPKKNKRLVVNDRKKVKIVQRIFKEFVADDRSMTDVADRLTTDRVPSPRGSDRWRFDAIKVILANPAYIGTHRFNTWSYAKYHSYRKGEYVKGGRRGRNPPEDWIVHENHHEAIIDVAVFERAQAKLARGKKGRTIHTPETNPYLLSGKLRCGRCGGEMWGEDADRKSYECSRAKYHGDCEGTRCRERNVLAMLSEYVEAEFMSDEAQIDLMKKAKRGELDTKHLPSAFKKLRKLLVGDEPTKPNAKRVRLDIEKFDKDIARAKANLALVDPQYIPDVQAKLVDLQAERTSLAKELNSRPAERDINEVVRDVLKKLFLLGTCKPELMKPVIRDLDSITVFTTIEGKGTGKRHQLERAEIRLYQVGGVTSNSNPHLPG